MARFTAVDGLRAWMAWLVVATHVVQQALPLAGGAAWVKLDLGGHAVDTFIIISGFVITHLLIERPTPYAAYIIPRFMRLFPAFVVACLLGGVTLWFAARWSAPHWFATTHAGAYSNLIEFLPAHVAAHLVMLHGAIPNSVLPMSEYAFIPPGWSVSLEWQFYLVAPFVIWLCGSRDRAVTLILAIAVMSFAYHFALKPHWDRPSVLVGTAKFFLVGIACRFAAPTLAGRVRYVAATGIGLGFSLLWIGSPSLAIWLVVYTFMLKGADADGGVDAVYTRSMRAALESRPILFLAERSYSTYLLHWPAITLIGTIATHGAIVPGPWLVVWMLLAVPVVLVAQEAVYRLVEMPGRRLGKRWALATGGRRIVKVDRETVESPGIRVTQ